MLVVHEVRPQWGVGEVLSAGNGRITIRFADEQRIFHTPIAALLPAPDGASGPSTRRAAAKKGVTKAAGGTKAAKSAAGASIEAALTKFSGAFPDGFKDAKYLKDERDEKVAGHEAFVRELGGGQGEALLAAGDVEEVVRRMLRVARSVKLMDASEKKGFADGLEFRDPSNPRENAAAAAAYAGALFALIAASAKGVDEAAFTKYCDAVTHLPVIGNSRPQGWVAATTLPALAMPEVFCLLRPEVTKMMATTMKADLKYAATPNWGTYQEFMKMVKGLLVRLRMPPYEARDFLDVQWFIVVAGYGV